MRRISGLLTVVVASSLLAWGAFAQGASEVTQYAAALVVINSNSVTLNLAGTGSPFPDDWRTSEDMYLVDALGELLPTARERGVLVIHLYGNFPYRNTPEEMLVFPEEIAPAEGDILIPRPGPNMDVFLDTPLLETLRAHGVRKLILAGLNTGYCINTSALSGLRYGFDTTVVADAHSGGGARYAQTYNNHWPSLGIHVVEREELDYGALTSRR